jgi:lauroyl/myristoyl acyltransferase
VDEPARAGFGSAGPPLHRAGTLAYWLVVAPLLACLPASLGYRVACRLGDLFFLVCAGKRSEVVGNLRAVLGNELSLEDAERLARDYFRFYLCEAIDVMRLRGRAHALGRLVEIRGRDHLDAALAGGKGAILCTAHVGSFISVLSLLHGDGYPLTAIGRWWWKYRPGLRSAERLAWNFAFARRVLRHRQRPYIEPAPGRVHVGLQAASVLRANEVVILCCDANPLEPDRPRAIDVPFLGRRARLVPGVVTLAQVTGAPVLMAFVHRLPDYHHQVVEISPPVPMHGDTAAAFGRCVAAMDAAIRASPAQWLYWYDRNELVGLGLLPEEDIAGQSVTIATSRMPASPWSPDSDLTVDRASVEQTRGRGAEPGKGAEKKWISR